MWLAPFRSVRLGRLEDFRVAPLEATLELVPVVGTVSLTLRTHRRANDQPHIFLVFQVTLVGLENFFKPVPERRSSPGWTCLVLVFPPIVICIAFGGTEPYASVLAVGTGPFQAVFIVLRYLPSAVLGP